MAEKYFTDDEARRIPELYRRLLRSLANAAASDEATRLRHTIAGAVEAGHLQRNRHGINPVVHAMETAVALCEMVSPDRNMAEAILLCDMCREGATDSATIESQWGDDTARLVEGLIKVSGLYSRHAAMESDNFRKLLLTFARDIRVIIIMIVDRLVLMRAINHNPHEKMVHDVAYEANYLYAPLAHRLGLYAIKSELEDMSLKYTARTTYTDIARRLNETKKERDAYIDRFIAPVREKLQQSGLKFELKGRTKSIYSIWNKMKKQKNDLDHIYDLFAIRIILDSPPAKEKSDCWLAYSIVTDLYRPNPSRMKDWISIPKSNGYESLHITVYGPDGRWVEVQIRTRRMDLIAEKGLAAHWKYKGGKAEAGLDAWMNNVRDILETAETGPMELMKNMKMDIYNKEVFVFTPKGDLYRLPQGASLLDFAFNIHTGLGLKCTGGKVNGKNEKLNYRLRSGDTVEIMTSQQQVPKTDWLNFTVTSKARNKIRQSVHEIENRTGTLGRELVERRFKNRKVELHESVIMKVIKRLGFKTVTEFYTAVAEERLDVATVLAEYEEMERRQDDTGATRSAEEFQLTAAAPDDGTSDDDVLVIGDNIKGINYKLAKCCNPIYGDSVFGFISAEGVIKIHRTDCPNAANIRQKYPYRLITTRWSGKVGQGFAATVKVLGVDDLGIVTNITSIINKQPGCTLRNISINSDGGMFQGFLVVGVPDTEALASIIKKLKTVKGIKDVQRS